MFVNQLGAGELSENNLRLNTKHNNLVMITKYHEKK